MGGYIGARSGTISATVANVQDVTATDTTPEITLKNTTETDADGSRSGKITFKGEQSGGEESTLAQIVASHDTALDNEAGDLIFKTNDGSDGASPTERLRIDSTGKSTFKDDVGIEGETPTLQMYDTNVTNNVTDISYDEQYIIDIDPNNVRGNSGLAIKTDGTEKYRFIDTAAHGGGLGIGTNTPLRQLHISNTSANSEIAFTAGTSGTSSILFGDGLTGTDIYRGYLQYQHASDAFLFATSATERMRLSSAGYLGLGRSDPVQMLDVYNGSNNQWVCRLRADKSSPQYFLLFDHGGSSVGSITGNGTSVTYGTTSDYRLKENVTDVTDGITRVKQLAPKRFNFIADADTTVDGFLAHEAATVVPEAVTGTKDAVQVWTEGEELPEGVSVGGSNLIKESSGTVEIGGASAVVEIGTGDNPTTISSEGVSVGGSNLIKRSGGTVSIGENSLKLREQGGRQQMWATDANGDSIDIDVTNGSRLLINGRDVENSIDNVGALSAALGSVPTISADSQLTCGFGGGTHSSAYALSAGCASRVSDRVSVNAALATVINNHTGDSDDNLSARAGFTFRLGKIDDSPKVAARKAAELHDKVAKLEERNKSLLALLQAQASRLERLEKIASGQLSLLGDRASSD